MTRLSLRFTVVAVLLGSILAACTSTPNANVAQSSSAPTTSVPSTATPAPPTATGAAATPTPVPTQAPSPTADALSVEALAQQLRPATVRVIAEFGASVISPEGLGAGTGIVYDVEHGYIITNAHVVEGASVVKIALADSTKTRPARVLGRAQCDDLAVLQVDSTEGLTAAPLGDSSQMKVGASVVALGYPLSFDLGNDLSVNVGHISQLRAQLGKHQDLIKIDAAINHGNSGGPLVNQRGEVIGINTLGFDGAQNQNFAIAMSYAKPIVQQLAQGKNRDHIGINLAPNQYADYFGTDAGMVVVGVASGSPADRAGMAQADLLLEVEGKAITSEEGMCDISRSHAEGDRLKVTVLRADTGNVLQGDVTIGQAGAEAGQPLAVIGKVEQEQPASANGAAAQGEARTSSDVCTQATVVGVDALAIRAEPSRSSAQLGAVERGGVVDVLCETPVDADGRVWVKVRSGSTEGYMSTNYLQ